MEQSKSVDGYLKPRARYDRAPIPLEATSNAHHAAPATTFIGIFEQGQAEERRRITRELHDSTLQLLTSASLALARLKRPHGPELTIEIITEMEDLLGEAQSELRTFAYLAHPPTLNVGGLRDALTKLVEGFGRRAGVKTVLHWQGTPNLAEPAAEIALYRVVQETLSNVLRHARATNVVVQVANRSMFTEIKIADDGIGMPSHPTHGVGLSGMRARLKDIGGWLTVLPRLHGTEVIASVPAQAANSHTALSARPRLRNLSSKCGRVADEVRDKQTRTALQEMACEFNAMADCMDVDDRHSFQK